MKKIQQILVAGTTAVAISLTGCGGGGGGSSDSGSTSAGGVWKVNAEVSSDTCGERISDVTQTFTINETSDSVEVSTGIVNLVGPKDGTGTTVEFSETNGDCQRSYQAQFFDLSSSPSPVALRSKSSCAAISCESTWSGTATQTN